MCRPLFAIRIREFASVRVVVWMREVRRCFGLFSRLRVNEKGISDKVFCSVFRITIKRAVIR